MSNNHHQICSNNLGRYSVQYNYKNLEIHRITELHIDDAKPNYTT